jgi:hypothetical protein
LSPISSLDLPSLCSLIYSHTELLASPWVGHALSSFLTLYMLFPGPGMLCFLGKCLFTLQVSVFYLFCEVSSGAIGPMLTFPTLCILTAFWAHLHDHKNYTVL